MPPAIVASCAGTGLGLQARQASYEVASPAGHSSVTQVCLDPELSPDFQKVFLCLHTCGPSLMQTRQAAGAQRHGTRKVQGLLVTR